MSCSNPLGRLTAVCMVQQPQTGQRRFGGARPGRGVPLKGDWAAYIPRKRYIKEKARLKAAAAAIPYRWLTGRGEQEAQAHLLT